jgi:thiamine-phosphate pyrophosphorylase
MQRLLPITPGTQRRGSDLEWLVEGLARAGCRQLLLREPHLDARAVVHLATRLSVRLPGLILHDRMSGARGLAARAGWGLHLSAQSDAGAVRADFPNRLGISCHSEAQVLAAQAAGLDYVLLSPIWRPTSKPNDERPCWGTKRLAQTCSGLQMMVFALGGITVDRVLPAREAGAFGVAVLGGIFGDDPVVDDVYSRARSFVLALSGR